MILDDITKTKRQEVAALKKHPPQAAAQELPKTRAFLTKGQFTLIAEIKKASPSAGLINPDYDPAKIARAYEAAGAGAISVLTDQAYFQGSLKDLTVVKQVTSLPVLRKDFIVDETQVLEARNAGADAVLLIARILNDNELAKLLKLTHQLGMEALVETHNAAEIERLLATDARIIGINNRDLDTLKVNVQTTHVLLKQFPALKKRIIVSESGIKTKHEVTMLREAGVDAVLVGESILKSHDIQAKVKELLG
jgi:indole-3-glycerol phosphate synthase